MDPPLTHHATVRKSPGLSDNSNLPLDEKLRDVSDTRISLRQDIYKLQNALDMLVSLGKDWCSYMQNSSLSSAKKEKLYSEAMESDDGHIEIIRDAQNKISELKLMLDFYVTEM